MKRGALLAVLSVLLFASGTNGFLGDIFKGWGIGVGGSAGIGGNGINTGIGIGDTGSKEGKDYSSGTGAGVGASLNLGPFGSINLGFGLGGTGKKPRIEENVPKVGIWSWLPKIGMSNSPEFKSVITGFLNRFPLFKQLENAESPAVFASIGNSLRNNPSLMMDIMSYINALSSDGQKAVLFLLNQVLNGIPNSDINIYGLPGASNDAIQKYRLLIDSLAPQSKQLVRVALSGLSPDQQKSAMDNLVNTYQGSLGQNGVQINLTPSSITNVIKVATSPPSIRDFGGINVGGGGGSFSINSIFVNQPEMQTTLNTFWSRLTPETERLLRSALGGLDGNGQRAVLTYLINASRSILSQPRTQIVFDDSTIQNVITMYKQNMLGGNVSVQVVEV